MDKELTNNKDFLDFRKSFGQRMQSLRKQKNLSQEELASRIGLDRVSIGYIEQGIRSPKLRTIFLVSKALNISTKDLFSF